MDLSNHLYELESESFADLDFFFFIPHCTDCSCDRLRLPSESPVLNLKDKDSGALPGHSGGGSGKPPPPLALPRALKFKFWVP